MEHNQPGDDDEKRFDHWYGPWPDPPPDFPGRIPDEWPQWVFDVEKDPEIDMDSVPHEVYKWVMARSLWDYYQTDQSMSFEELLELYDLAPPASGGSTANERS